MGYIAPITNFQAIQYAERDSIRKYDPYIFVPITRTQYLINERTEESYSHLIKLKPLHKKTLGNNTQDTIDQMYSKLTGKGRLFNERA